jgi:hypothetical protein
VADGRPVRAAAAPPSTSTTSSVARTAARCMTAPTSSPTVRRTTARRRGTRSGADGEPGGWGGTGDAATAGDTSSGHRVVPQVFGFLGQRRTRGASSPTRPGISDRRRNRRSPPGPRPPRKEEVRWQGARARACASSAQSRTTGYLTNTASACRFELISRVQVSSTPEQPPWRQRLRNQPLWGVAVRVMVAPSS